MRRLVQGAAGAHSARAPPALARWARPPAASLCGASQSAAFVAAPACSAGTGCTRSYSASAAVAGPAPKKGTAGAGEAASSTAPAEAVSATEALFGPKGTPPGVTRLLARYHSIPIERTRCFSIIAHIDHGKSTLADKLLEMSKNIWPTAKGRQQVLDTLEVERQRGITVKAQSASMVWRDPRDGLEYLFNLIDTPGHVDFSYEVSRSLAACQGALLLVDASQGVQAQTVANHNAAVEAGLKIIPVLTKIDLPVADPEPCLDGLEAAFGIPPDTVIWTSAKAGQGIEELFPALIDRIPPPAAPTARAEGHPRCLLFDSWFDPYRGVVCSVLVTDGVLRPGDQVVAAHSGDKFTVQEVGLMAPAKCPVGSTSGGSSGFLPPPVEEDAATGADPDCPSSPPPPGASKRAPPASSSSSSPSSSSSGPSSLLRRPVRGGLGAGHIGYMVCGMRSTKQAQVGDTFYHADAPLPPLAGFRPAKPMVFASLYPVDSGDFNALVTAVERLTLNDASVTVERESSSSLGFGLRCGFLGLLHMDVFHQRLQQEFSTPVIITAPMVGYKLQLHRGSPALKERLRLEAKAAAAAAAASSGGSAAGSGAAPPPSASSKLDPSRIITVERPGDFPPSHDVERYFEPTAHVSILSPPEYLSGLMALLQERRGVQEDIVYLNAGGGHVAATSLHGAGGSAGEGGVTDADKAAAAAAGMPGVIFMDTAARRKAAAPVAGLGEEEEGSGGAGGDLEAALAAEAAALEAQGGDDDEEDEDDEEEQDDEEEEVETAAPPTTGGGGGGGGGSSAPARVALKYRVPWAEVVGNLYDAVKSLTAGYASLDWTPGPYQEAPIVKVDMLLNGKPVDALSFVAHREKAVGEGRRVASKLRSVIERQQYEVVIQAAVGSKIFARERIAPYRKDVLTKSGKTVGGGDRTRKMKLLAKQKEGKKRMRTVGNVALSQEAFHSILTSK